MNAMAQDAAIQPASGRPDTLALLLQGVFTAIVRIQSGRQALGEVEVFRRRMRSALQEAERDAIAARYSTDDLNNAQFAVVALLDEAILSSKDAARDEWRKKTLNMEIYGEANAGEVFYDRLQGLMRREDSARLADVLEVYLLCLLLGFEGRMGGGNRGEALMMADRIKRRVEAVRGLDYSISPKLDLRSDAPAPAPAPANPLREWLKWAAVGLAAVVLLFLIYKLHLAWRLGQLEEIVSR